jgi:hypothetical protein
MAASEFFDREGRDAQAFHHQLVDLEPSDSWVGWRISRSRHPQSGAVLEIEATFVAFPAWDGEVGILHDRAPLLYKMGTAGE